MKKLLFILFAGLCCANALFAQEDVSLDVGGGCVIKGTLMIPAGVEKPPVVLLIAGSGPTDRNGNNPQMQNNSLKNLAVYLQKAGIATLRYDKRGIAASAYAGMREEDVTLDTFADDARKLADMLHSDGRFPEVVLAGHSEGAQLAGIAAADNPAVAKVISIAGMGRPMDEVLIEQLVNGQMPVPLLDEVKAMIEILKKGELIAEVNPMLMALFRPSIQPFMISWFNHNPAKDIARLTVPVMVVQGGTDIQVAKTDMERLVQAYPGAVELYIEDMNHVLKKIETTDRAAQVKLYSDPSIPNHEALAPAIVRFVKSK